MHKVTEAVPGGVWLEPLFWLILHICIRSQHLLYLFSVLARKETCLKVVVLLTNLIFQSGEAEAGAGVSLHRGAG